MKLLWLPSYNMILFFIFFIKVSGTSNVTLLGSLILPIIKEDKISIFLCSSGESSLNCSKSNTCSLVTSKSANNDIQVLGRFNLSLYPNFSDR